MSNWRKPVDPKRERIRAYARTYAASQREKRKALGIPEKDRTEYFREWGKKRLEKYRAKRKRLDAIRYKKKRVEILAKNAKFHRVNKEGISKRKSEWRDTNYERVRSSEKRYRKSERGRTADDACKRRRVAQIFSCDIRATAAEIHPLKQRYTECYYCKKPRAEFTPTIDHYMPLGLGGAHAIENLVVACKSCNSRKSKLHPAVWRARSVFAAPNCPNAQIEIASALIV